MGAVEIAHVGGGIFLLGIRKRVGPPVGGLLLLADIDGQKLAQEILEAVTIGVGADEFGGDLGAEYRPGLDAEMLFEDSEIEAGEMIELEARTIGQKRFEIGGAIIAGKAHQVFVAVAIGELDEAEPVAVGQKAHGFGIDGYGPGREDRGGGEIALVEMYSHGRCA